LCEKALWENASLTEDIGLGEHKSGGGFQLPWNHTHRQRRTKKVATMHCMVMLSGKDPLVN